MGIPDDLIQDIAIRELAFGAGTLHAAVASYVQSPRYYRALIAGGARYNLNGQPCGEVTPQEQKEAETRLMMLNDRRKERNILAGCITPGSLKTPFHPALSASAYHPPCLLQ